MEPKREIVKGYCINCKKELVDSFFFCSACRLMINLNKDKKMDPVKHWNGYKQEIKRKSKRETRKKWNKK